MTAASPRIHRTLPFPSRKERRWRTGRGGGIEKSTVDRRSTDVESPWAGKSPDRRRRPGSRVYRCHRPPLYAAVSRGGSVSIRATRSLVWCRSGAILSAAAGVLSLSTGGLIRPITAGYDSVSPAIDRLSITTAIPDLIMCNLRYLAMISLMLAACTQQPTQNLGVALKGIEKSRFVACAGPPVLELPRAARTACRS